MKLFLSKYSIYKAFVLLCLNPMIIHASVVPQKVDKTETRNVMYRVHVYRTSQNGMHESVVYTPDVPDTTSYHPVVKVSPAYNPVVKVSPAYNPVVSDTTAYNPVVKDTAVYNLVLQDTKAYNPVVKDTAVYNLVVQDTKAYNPVVEDTTMYFEGVQDLMKYTPPHQNRLAFSDVTNDHTLQDFLIYMQTLSPTAAAKENYQYCLHFCAKLKAYYRVKCRELINTFLVENYDKYTVRFILRKLLANFSDRKAQWMHAEVFDRKARKFHKRGKIKYGNGPTRHIPDTRTIDGSTLVSSSTQVHQTKVSDKTVSEVHKLGETMHLRYKHDTRNTNGSTMTSNSTQVHLENLALEEIKEYEEFVALMQQTFSKDPLRALLSVSFLLIVMMVAIKLCGMRPVKTYQEAPLDYQDDVQYLGIHEILKRKRPYLPKYLLTWERRLRRKFKKRRKMKREHYLTDGISDNDEEENLIYSRIYDF